MRTTEQPERADRLLAGLAAGKHELIAPTVFGQGPRPRVHSPEYLSFLAEAWDAWSALGNAGPEIIANVHPVRHAATYPTHIVGRLGWHTADTGLSDRARHMGRRLRRHRCCGDCGADGAGRRGCGLRAVPAARPSCVSAMSPAASAFSTTVRLPPRICGCSKERVAILDVDVHHGNGTQGIFYERSDVLTVSIHADPAAYYPVSLGLFP